MRFLLLAPVLLVAACAAPQRPVSRPPPAPPQVQSGGPLLGATAAQLTARFGAPALRVVEGDGTKLQFKGRACILDTYLYPPRGGRGEAVTLHADARDIYGRDVDLDACIAALSPTPPAS
ncbi:hypothetical protein [Sphingomicrobium lutaoense]|uniref:Lipoprotein n=1 Tax=Sphingomicrobium lutaoense TaxID=515949 RepID=A0A839Z342_9SPHN|nr:hypothetical protein [Sphingomicrobium lutaoense]MBB3765030.1 hypothetical protein [Sphingomicrobium lutaoense]